MVGSTDVTSCAQSLVFMRYINSGKRGVPVCEGLQTTTIADILEMKAKHIFILQSCSVNMFVGFSLMELVQ